LVGVGHRAQSLSERFAEVGGRGQHVAPAAAFGDGITVFAARAKDGFLRRSIALARGHGSVSQSPSTFCPTRRVSAPPSREGSRCRPRTSPDSEESAEWHGRGRRVCERTASQRWPRDRAGDRTPPAAGEISVRLSHAHNRRRETAQRRRVPNGGVQ
jgi:hypothetical protein